MGKISNIQYPMFNGKLKIFNSQVQISIGKYKCKMQNVKCKSKMQNVKAKCKMQNVKR